MIKWLGDAISKMGALKTLLPATPEVMQAPGSPCLRRVLHGELGLGCGLHPRGSPSTQKGGEYLDQGHCLQWESDGYHRLVIPLPLVLHGYGSQNRFFPFAQGPFCFYTVSGGVLLSVGVAPDHALNLIFWRAQGANSPTFLFTTALGGEAGMNE